MRTKAPIPVSEIASLSGLTQATVYRVLAGRGTAEAAVILHHSTHGVIPAWKLRPDLWEEGQVPPMPSGSHGHPSMSSISEAAA